MPEAITYKRAEELERRAKAGGRPTPRNAAEVLIKADAERLAALEAEADQVKARLTERLLRANHKQDDAGRGLPERHPDRISQRELGTLIKKDPMQVKRWTGRMAERQPDKLPRYNHTPGSVAAP